MKSFTRNSITKKRIMGFGHRVYKTVDPRAETLKKKIMEMNDMLDNVKSKSITL
ncbi:citrate/2-methylcitrate synthase [Lentibacillus sp. CBA3610]|uniref:citrate/2-methylcitrate synthase n=1 Tax=Lentibacillus sp. CBA3610 TaxID=2518176 RepID=UPI001595CC91|nr:citrate/2-methylcitrate synthase [Lentibacillus sp. CBA3610]QKY69145.1 hypothetical protein Len3610_05560 [Lentibacillus sp. CBA3610]